jgi:hypothetical protein
MRRSDGCGRYRWPRRRKRAGPPGIGGDRGYVTAEAAVVIPLLVGLTGLLIWGLMAGAAQIRCVDAARAGAREAARSETAAHVRAAALRDAPAGSTVTVRHTGDLIRVRITVPLPRFPMKITAEAAALDEATVGEGVGT